MGGIMNTTVKKFIYTEVHHDKDDISICEQGFKTIE